MYRTPFANPVTIIHNNTSWSCVISIHAYICIHTLLDLYIRIYYFHALDHEFICMIKGIYQGIYISHMNLWSGIYHDISLTTGPLMLRQFKVLVSLDSLCRAVPSLLAVIDQSFIIIIVSASPIGFDCGFQCNITKMF